MGVRAANAVIRSFRPDYRIRLEREGGTNLVDCALARPVDEKEINPEILGIGRVRGIGEIKPGLPVRKSGRTSGITEGKVIAVHVSLNVTMGHSSDVVRFNEQVMLEMRSLGGDSGSLVVDMENRAVGLLFAGSEEHTVCNPIQAVLDQLGVDLV